MKPFDGYDPDGQYAEMMQFIIDVETAQAQIIVPWLKHIVAPKSVIDVGCGPGTYLVPFDCEVFGIDACPVGGQLLKPKEFKRVDLRFPYAPKHRFDLVICLEVAEHLERHWSERLIDTLCDCGDTIVFSGAVPGQGGTYHYNEQPHEFWLDMFKERHDYVPHPMNNEWRGLLATLDTPPHSGWLKNNTFLLTKNR